MLFTHHSLLTVPASVASIIVMQDDFTGTTINTVKWTVTDPVDSVIVSQNGNLRFNFTHAGTVVAIPPVNYLQSILTITTGAVQSYTNKSGGNGNAPRGMFMWLDANNFAGIIRGATDVSKARLYLSDNNVAIYNFQTTLAIDNNIFKITLDGTNVKYWYWNTTQWTQLGTTQTHANFTGNKTILLTGGDATTDTSGYNYYDDAYLTNADYSTQYPT